MSTAPTPTRTPRAVAIAVQLAPVALIVVGEAAWISVVAGLLQEFALRSPAIGIPGLAVFVAAGIVLARLLGPRLGERWPAAAFALVLAGGLVGCLVSPDARQALGDGIGPALLAHPGGLLAGLAVLRGFAYARLPLAEDTVTHLLAIGVPGLAVASMLGGVIGDPYRAQFLGDALAAAIVFIAASALALAFARVDAIGLDGGFDWRRNPPWLLLTVGLLAGAILIAVPLSLVAGTVVSVVVSLALGPLFILGIATGLDRTARRVAVFFVAVLVIAWLITGGPGPGITLPDPATPGFAGQGPPTPAEQVIAMSVGGLLLFGAVVGILILIAVWMRRTPAAEGMVGETRTIEPGGDDLVPRRRRNRFGRRPEPRTAAEAYVALVDDLERHPHARRDAAETPAGHAARLRAAGRMELSLDLLAADYALARYGGVTLGPREDRRAVGRWRTLRRRLAARPTGMTVRAGPDGVAPAPDAELPVDFEPRRTL